jgi:signal transduction histidine kinase
MALASVVLGWLAAGRVLHPLRTITAAARDVSSTSLDRRLALTGPDDELKELADTFDGLLGRLERSFQSQRQFVANASHELRTPLTLERALLEAALTDPEPTTESLRTTCERLLAATAQQDRLTEALLTLATSEQGIERWEPFDLAILADQVLASRQAVAERLSLQVKTSLTAAPSSGDPDLTERLVANLVDNALHYNIPGGWVELVTGTDTGQALICVSNTGPVVPAHEVHELLQPFRRLGSRRTRHDDGHGLGLAIVSAIAAAHHATLSASARPGGGLSVEVRFPLFSRKPC